LWTFFLELRLNFEIKNSGGRAAAGNLKEVFIMYANSFPVDRKNLDGQFGASAVEVEWPELSFRARQGLAYLEDSAFLFRYRGQFVITDESGDLTECGTGAMGDPAGCPRLVTDSVPEIQKFLEDVWSDLCEDKGFNPSRSFCEQIGAI
jgi:hypothetical protein